MSIDETGTGAGRLGRRRAVAGLVIALLWLAGMGVLAKRELFRPATERLADAAMRITPGAVYYAVMQGERQIGFASSSIDTAAQTISVDDYLVADLPMGGRAHRASARTHVVLTRALKMKSFTFSFDGDANPIVARGRVADDSVLLLTVSTGANAPVDSQRVSLGGPILLPTLVPLAVALGETPGVGKRFTLPVFDPIGLVPRQVALVVRGESTFVVNDSAVQVARGGLWRGVQPDTLHAWRLESETGAGGAAFNGWVDEQGRVLQTTQLGLHLRRLPYEVAFENWRIQGAVVDVPRTVTRDRDILETTAIGANRAIAGNLDELRVVLAGADLRGFDLGGARQRLDGDTLTVRREGARALAAPWLLPDGGRRLVPELTLAEPLVQSKHPEIVKLANRLTRGQKNPRIVAERINRWVHDSLAKRITFGVPSALQVLRSRSGDCNEHTQLFVALARAAGIPARVAAGLAYIDGRFYYHAWPEVYLRDWVAVDPTLGEFPADASHLRFVVGGLGRQAELLRLMGRLEIRALGSGTRRE